MYAKNKLNIYRKVTNESRPAFIILYTNHLDTKKYARLCDRLDAKGGYRHDLSDPNGMGGQWNDVLAQGF
jgi:hypothetical protein